MRFRFWKRFSNDRRGIMTDMLGWWLLAAVILVVVLLSYLILTGKLQGFFDFLNRLIRFRSA